METRTVSGVRVKICTAEEVFQTAASEIVTIGSQILEKKLVFLLNLSGGQTILPVLGLLASELADALPWKRVHLFWGDEHWWPMFDPRTNFVPARRELEPLVAKGLLPEQRIHRIRTAESQAEVMDLGKARQEAERYAEEIRDYTRVSFDLTIIGLGEDLHFASIRPYCPTEVLKSDRVVEAVQYPVDCPGARIRVTLTPEMFTKSQRTIMLVTGANKAKALADIMAGGVDLRTKPGSIIRQIANAQIITNQECARLLPAH